MPFPDADWPKDPPDSATFSGENVAMMLAPIMALGATLVTRDRLEFLG